MTRRRILIHVGLHKTATTLVQQRVFAPTGRALQARLPPGSGPVTEAMARPVIQRLNTVFRRADPSSHWDGPEARALVRDLAELADRVTGVGPLILSSEDLSTPDFFMREAELGHPTGPGPHPVVRHVAGLLRTIGWDPADVHILLGVRRQAHYLAALYAQWGHRAVTSQRGFERGVARILARPEGAANDWLDLHRLAIGFRDVVGAENVTVLPIEAISGPDYATALARAAGLEPDEVARALRVDEPINARSSQDRVWQLREPRPHHVGRIARLRAVRRRGTVRLHPSLEARIVRRYAASNHRLDAVLPWDLVRLGYLGPDVIPGGPASPP